MSSVDRPHNAMPPLAKLLRGWHVMHEGRGDSWTLYFGRHRGACFISVDVRGWTGWSSRPKWLPGGWEFYNPTLSTGRLFTDGSSRTWEAPEIKLPARLVSLYRWHIRPSGRRFMREQKQGRPMEVPHA